MKRLFLSALAFAAAGMTAGAPAHAADSVMKVCGAKYQAAKTAKTLPAGQTWNQYLAACRGTQPKTVAAAPAPAAVAPAAKAIAATTAAKPAAPAKPGWLSKFSKPAAPAATPVAAAPVAHPTAVAAPVAAKAPGTQSPAMAAVHDRQRQCGAQWKADKAAGKIPAGQTWPKYWSACNTRLKG